MSGHSKWSKIKRQKGADDAKRGQVFTRITREIIVAAKTGGGNPEGNFRLRLAIEKARDANMPSDNINRAIAKGTGEGEGAGALAEITFEGYGPKGVAILVDTVTDNRNRTVQEVRAAFSRYGGSLGAAGSVAWLFDNKGVLTVDVDNEKEAEDLGLVAIEGGAEDVKIEKDYIEVYTGPKDIEMVKKALEAKKPVSSAEVQLVPKTSVTVEGDEASKVLTFLERLEELDDVQRVSSNVDIPEATLEKLRAAA